MKKTISLLLALLTLLASLTSAVACSESTVAPEETTAPAATEETAPVDTEDLTDLELRQLISDDLPAVTFDDMVFRIACEEAKSYEVFTEEITGEVTNDAVYNRNLAVEERFKAKIENVVVTEANNHVKTIVTSGDDAYELIGFKAYQSYTPITAKVLLNWYDMPNINLEKPWYNSITNNAATFNDKLFNATCSLGISMMQYTYAMFFNTRLCEEYGYPATDLYNLVYDNKWVYDKFYEIVSKVYIDLNGNGKTDVKDVFGYQSGNTHPLDVWLTAFDQPITSKDDDGNIVINLLSEKTISALEKIYTLTYDTPSTHFYAAEYTEFTAFADGLIAIAPLPFRVAYSELREMQDTYGILPYPKWDENQTQYRTNIYDQYSAFGFPKTIPEERYEFVGVMTEVLNAESYKTVYPAFYDVALKNKYSEDADTANMVDIVMEGANMDFSFMFGESNFIRIPYFFRDLIIAKSTDITSKYTKIQKALSKQIDKLYTYYED